MVYDANSPRHTLLGQALALMAKYMLDIMQPYPRDSNAVGVHGVRQ